MWDSENNLIRKIDQNQNVTTLAGQYRRNSNVDGSGTNAAFSSISQMYVDGSGNLILASVAVSSIRKMNASSNVVTMAGSFTQRPAMPTVRAILRGSMARMVSAFQAAQYTSPIPATNESAASRIIPQPQVVTGANLGIGTFAGVTITGVVGRTYQIQSSPNMATWTTRATVLLTFSPYLWIDQNPASEK